MEIITLAHGSGGRATNKLINDIFYKYFNNDFLAQKNDSTVVPALGNKLAITTDSFVINPIFFPGGDIGKLSICGTVNDIVMSGAKPMYITVGFIIEEGLSIDDLERLVKSMAETAKEAGITIVAGDTKVVEKGKGDKIFINTTGVGVIEDNNYYLSGDSLKEGDKIIISGTIGDHGICILNKRKDMNFGMEVESDCGLLHTLVRDILEVSNGVRVLRDPTRGGVATTLNEFAKESNVTIEVLEEALPVKGEVSSMCDILGLEPLYIANEGKLLVAVTGEDCEKVLQAMRNNPMGKEASIIGEVVSGSNGKVYLKTEIGGKRILTMPEGELLVRIC